MKMTLNTLQIADYLKNDSYASWSYNGAKALAEYLEEYEESTGEELELDVCSIRCDFAEYSSPQEAAEDHGWKPDPHVADDGQECDADALQWLQDRTSVIEFDGGIIVSSF
jgi:hypothetical protein